MLARTAAALIFCAAAHGTGVAQDKTPPGTAKVEVMLAKEHVPDRLNAGDRVDLLIVVNSITSRTGKTAYSTKPVTPGAVVVSVKQTEKPNTPEEAVKVQLQVSKDQVAKIERIKSQFARVVETVPGG